MKTLEDQIDELIPEGTSDIQARETRQAIIAGMVLFRNIALEVSNQSVKTALSSMAELERQLLILMKELK